MRLYLLFGSFVRCALACPVFPYYSRGAFLLILFLFLGYLLSSSISVLSLGLCVASLSFAALYQGIPFPSQHAERERGESLTCVGVVSDLPTSHAKYEEASSYQATFSMLFSIFYEREIL